MKHESKLSLVPYQVALINERRCHRFRPCILLRKFTSVHFYDFYTNIAFGSDAFSLRKNRLIQINRFKQKRKLCMF